MSYAVRNRAGSLVKLPLSRGGEGLIVWCKGFVTMGEAPRAEYRCSFAMAFPNDVALDHVLAISPTGTDAIDVTKDCRIYDGSQTEPDPLIEQDCGPGSPAYTGTRYVVFEDLLLTQFENCVPWVYAGQPE